MRVYLNCTPRAGAYGGANAFLRTLTGALAERGVEVTADPDARVDVALLNALTEGLHLDDVRRIGERGTPIVHRKTGFRARGAPGLRAVVGGVVVGDAHQISFGPWVAHSIFQSAYSRDVFVAGGFTGSCSVIRNATDPHLFHPPVRRTAPGADGPVRVVISTWSTDPSKGFARYAEIDDALRGRTDVAVTLVGRVPDGMRLEAIRVVAPLPPPRLADELRRHDVLLALTEHESCSNALLEGLSCGLPAIYLDSGANREVAEPFGVAWGHDLDEALGRLLPRHAEIVAALEERPFAIEPIAERYRAVLEAVVDGREPPDATIL